MINFARCALGVLILTTPLTGCATGHSNATALDRVNYPLVVSYTLEKQRQAAVEIAEGKTPVLAEMVADYLRMRDETRVLLGENVPR